MRLILEDGTVFSGTGFGAQVGVAGEVVFNTAMCGYVETLTDPSYRGQILVLTYPLVGNYGVPAPRTPGSLAGPYESDRIQVQGLVVQNYSWAYSHHSASRSLADWLKGEAVPGITGIDTRALTKHLRKAGTMRGRIVPHDRPPTDPPDVRATEMHHQVFREVAPPRAISYGHGDRTVLLVDVGAKDNIVRSLLDRSLRVIRVPWYEDLFQYYDEADGVVIGNGPGDPADLDPLVAQVRRMLQNASKPVLGICLGHQVVARAAGATTFKLPYGHRGVNQPVQEVWSGRCFITSQNHGYAVDHQSLPSDWEPWFVNLNDGSNEGIRSKTRPFYAVQFHPEARPGPQDTSYLFDEFVQTLRAPAFPQG